MDVATIEMPIDKAKQAYWEYREAVRVVVGDDFHQERIEDDPVVPLLHGLRAIKPPPRSRWLSLFRRLRLWK